MALKAVIGLIDEMPRLAPLLDEFSVSVLKNAKDYLAAFRTFHEEYPFVSYLLATIFVIGIVRLSVRKFFRQGEDEAGDASNQG